MIQLTPKFSFQTMFPFAVIENDRILVQPTAKNSANRDIVIGFEGAPMAPDWNFEMLTHLGLAKENSIARDGTNPSGIAFALFKLS